jgi:hypothetical protein
MEELLKRANINIPQLHRYIKMAAAFELSKLSEPCYFPPLKKTYHELLRQLRLSDRDVKEFIKRMYKGTRAEKWNLWRMPDHNIMMFIMHVFLKNRKKDGFEAAMLYYMIRQYSHLMHKHFIRFCDIDLFRYALENLTKTHLFSREKTIGNSIIYLSREMQKKYTNDLANWDVDKLIDFISASRHRISQSVKSFAQHYYRSHKEGTRIKTHPEDVEDEYGVQQQLVTLEKGRRVVDNTVKRITVYKTIDRKAFEEAKRTTKVRNSIADMILKSLPELKYSDNIKSTLLLFVKDATKPSEICGKDYIVYVRRLMSIKRTRSRMYFKQQINVLLMKILKENDFIETYNSYTSQTQFIINSFLAFYLTGVLKNSIC